MNSYPSLHTSSWIQYPSKLIVYTSPGVFGSITTELCPVHINISIKLTHCTGHQWIAHNYASLATCKPSFTFERELAPAMMSDTWMRKSIGTDASQTRNRMINSSERGSLSGCQSNRLTMFHVWARPGAVRRHRRILLQLLSTSIEVLSIKVTLWIIFPTRRWRIVINICSRYAAGHVRFSVDEASVIWANWIDWIISLAHNIIYIK